MTGDTESNIAKNLLRGTHKGEINWHCQTDDWNGPVEAYVGEYRVFARKDGTIELFSGRVKYSVEAGKMGETVYRAARNFAWEHEPYEDVIERFDEYLIDRFENR